MSFKKICICDNCKEIIHEFLFMYSNIQDYEIGYTHMCKRCQIKEYGFFKGDMKNLEPSITKLVDNNFWDLI